MEEGVPEQPSKPPGRMKMFYPVLYNIVLSFTDYDLFSPIKFTGLEN